MNDTIDAPIPHWAPSKGRRVAGVDSTLSLAKKKTPRLNMRPGTFNNRALSYKPPRVIVGGPPILDSDGAPIFEIEPTRTPALNTQASAIKEPAPFVGRCYDCGTRRPDRVGGVCPGGCEILRPLTAADVDDGEETPCAY